ncbi:MAG: phosphoglycerate mutase [Pirellulaceae bacterium]|nr:MAG: phosphoglycerate mutase [Pirellulaceae bacterium]
MLKVILVRPGATTFDEQRRFKGSLDLPLSPLGEEQVRRLAEELKGEPIERVYVGPCTAARQTAAALVAERNLPTTELADLRNVDHGLWHGRLIDEVRRQQPRLYRLWQEMPEQFSPPGGESWQEARQRALRVVRRLCRSHRAGVVCIVVAEPLATLIQQQLGDAVQVDVWKAECDCGGWQLVQVVPELVGLTG